MAQSVEEGYDSKQSEMRATVIAITVLTVVFVALRIWGRIWRKVKVGADDITLLVSLTMLFIMVTLYMLMVKYGLGRPAKTLDPAWLVTLSKLLLGLELVYCPTVAMVKISLLLMYYRIFHTRTFKIATWILGGISVAWAFSINMVSIFQCTPIEKTWHPLLPGTCVDLKTSFIANGVPNFATDCAILALPGPRVWKLHASKQHRISVILIFALGTFVLFASAYRFTTLFKFDPTDMPGTLADACTWCVVECATGIISACLPTLRVYISAIRSLLGCASTDDGPSKSSGGWHSNNEYGHNSGNRHGGQLFRRADDSNLRPPHSKVTSEVRTKRAPSFDNSSSDEVPLNNIRVERDVEWSESTKRVSVPSDTNSRTSTSRSNRGL